MFGMLAAPFAKLLHLELTLDGFLVFARIISTPLADGAFEGY